ncbi:hypothetical protein ACJ73_00792 [Blastomyces percursus]|uniref:Uncharacterized protein n=1 Tax=Blastomyces percursus TaxID=1658174 RepID=A0A1J9RIL9_9EURO|nr:hypothetical protein ACJ73_00792 [Blastomyces percursus]
MEAESIVECSESSPISESIENENETSEIVYRASRGSHQPGGYHPKGYMQKFKHRLRFHMGHIAASTSMAPYTFLSLFSPFGFGNPANDVTTGAVDNSSTNCTGNWIFQLNHPGIDDLSANPVPYLIPLSMECLEYGDW